MLLAVAPAVAQVYTPPKQNPAPSSGNQTTIVNESASNSGSQNALGSDLPYFDPSTETFSFDGKMWNVNDNRVFRARFEKYLNAPAVDAAEDQAYRNSLEEVAKTLSPHNQDRNRFPKAVAQLQRLAQFPQDEGMSESLANAVYRVYLARTNSAQLKSLNVELQRQRKQLDWNVDAWSNNSRGLGESRRLGEDASEEAAKKVTDTQTAGHVARYLQNITELEAERASNRAAMEVNEAEAKLEFQALILQLFLQRRFEHVILASRLYTGFYKDGRGRLDFEQKSDTQKAFLETLGYNPTISTLETASQEAIRDVEEAVKSFQFLLERSEIDGATKQLQQAFVVGEFLPATRAVAREDKRKVLAYAQKGFQLVNSLEVKDYGRAEQLVAEMTSLASDFDNSKPTAAISAAKLSSNMRIRTAKNAAMAGDLEKFEENIAEAANIWPSNPELKSQFDLIADSADVQQQAKIEFDRLLGTQSYRQIYNNKARFMAATVEDVERQKALEEIVNNILEIETVIKQAESLKKAGNDHAAWEIVEQTFQKFPDDVPLSARRSDLTTDVAPFVKALKQAESLEEADQFGASLSWYLSARNLYQQSEFAENGIERMVEEILPEEVGGDSGLGE